MHIKISNKEFESQIAQNDDFCVFPDKKKKTHKSLISGGFEGGKHSNLKILLVFY